MAAISREVVGRKDERATLPIDPVTTEDFMSEAEFLASL
jgi:hypothetical protein